jgi:tetrahydromethanopterin S-methyltransferase subunit A
MKEVEEIDAKRTSEFVFDKKGFFYIYLDKRRNRIVVEHYKNIKRDARVDVSSGEIQRIIVGQSAEEIGHTLAKLEIISRVDHAIYLGRELQKAEIALKRGIKYEQGEELKF